MSVAHEILSVIAERGEITLPELQVILSRPYKTVREGIRELVDKKMIIFKGGMTYDLAKRESDRPSAGNLPSMDGKLRLLADEMASDPRIEEVIRYFAENPDGSVTVSKVQILLRIGFGSALSLLEHCVSLGIFARDYRFALSTDEVRALLGEDAMIVNGKKKQPAEDRLMTREEYREHLRARFRREDESADEEGEKKDGLHRFLDGIEERKRDEWEDPWTDSDDDFSAAAALQDFEEYLDDDDDDFCFDPERAEDESDADEAPSDEDPPTPAEPDALSERLREARERLMRRLEEIRKMTDDESDLPKKKKKKKKKP